MRLRGKSLSCLIYNANNNVATTLRVLSKRTTLLLSFVFSNCYTKAQYTRARKDEGGLLLMGLIHLEVHLHLRDLKIWIGLRRACHEAVQKT